MVKLSKGLSHAEFNKEKEKYKKKIAKYNVAHKELEALTSKLNGILSLGWEGDEHEIIEDAKKICKKYGLGEDFWEDWDGSMWWEPLKEYSIRLKHLNSRQYETFKLGKGFPRYSSARIQYSTYAHLCELALTLESIENREVSLTEAIDQLLRFKNFSSQSFKEFQKKYTDWRW